MNIEKGLASPSLISSTTLSKLHHRILQKKHQGLGLSRKLRGFSDHCLPLLFDYQKGEFPSSSNSRWSTTDGFSAYHAVTYLQVTCQIKKETSAIIVLGRAIEDRGRLIEGLSCYFNARACHGLAALVQLHCSSISNGHQLLRQKHGGLLLQSTLDTIRGRSIQPCFCASTYIRLHTIIA